MAYKIRVRAMITDYILGIVCAGIAIKLFLYPTDSIGAPFWSATFIMIALSALLAGTYHGMHEMADPRFARYLWKAVLGTLAGASALLLIAVAVMVPTDAIRYTLIIVALAKLLGALTAIAYSDRFHLVMYDYLISLVIAGVLYGIFMPTTASIWLIAGVVLSLIAAAVQYWKLSPSRYLNHNDVYHLLETIALIMMYAGIISL